MIPPVVLVVGGLGVTGTAGLVVIGVLTVAVGSHGVGLDDEVGLDQDEVEELFTVVGPQPDRITSAATTAPIGPMVFFMSPPCSAVRAARSQP